MKATSSAPPSPSFGYSVSLGWFFTDVPLTDRFGLARDAGFRAVEMFWPDVRVADLEAARRESGMDVALINMYEGDYAAGQRGLACRPEYRDLWREKLEEAIEVCRAVRCPRINVLTGDAPAGVDRQPFRACLIDNLRWASPQAARAGITLTIEPLNHLSHPDYLCQYTRDVLSILDEIDDDTVTLQYDVYHAQRSEGNLISTLRSVIGRVGHIQIADVPTRSAPGTGEINFHAVLTELGRLGYTGYVGLEYDPANLTDPFAWLPVHERGLNPQSKEVPRQPSGGGLIGE